jgi:hypothetical protein
MLWTGRTYFDTSLGTGKPMWVASVTGGVATWVDALGGSGGVLSVALGGTGLSSGTSGGILGFTGTTTLASSALLNANAIVLGGGAGATPATPLGLGTTTTLLHGNAAGAPTWGKVVLTTDVSGTLPVGNGGTNSATALSGSSIMVSNGSAVIQGSAGTTTTVLHGNAAGVPTYAAVSLTADVSGILPVANGGTGSSSLGAALTKADDTNVTLTLTGSPSTALVNAATITAGWTGQLGLTRGGTAASLTASNGGIVYSTASAFAILGGTATAGQILRSGASTTPAWSTPTFPNTATSNKALVGDGTNVVLSTPTIPLTSSPSANKVMVGDGTNWVASTPTVPLTSSPAANKVLVGDATNWVASTPTVPLTSSPSAGKVMIGDGTNWVASTPTYPNASATSGKILISDGTNFVSSTPTYPNASATAGKVIRSDGTNYVSWSSTIPDTFSQGDVIYASAANVFSALAKTATANSFLKNSGTSNNPAWSTISASALSDGTTGSGAIVLATSPALVTPTLGVATATSVTFGGTAISTFATGTFTPTIAFGGASTGVAYSQQVGTYTQINKRVFYTIAITLTSKGSSTGAFTIATTLPTADSTYSATVGVMSNAASLTGPPVFQIRGSATTLDGYINTGSGTTSLTDTNFTNTSSFNFSGQYTVP